MKVNGEWQWVFCHNDVQYGGVVTTVNRQKALHGEHALKFFQNKYGDSEFRLERNGEKVD